ncbi:MULTISPECIES: translation factor GTPase family protein [Clostridium]|uniref:Tetracycline resistance protein TetM n=1 Tax=Clostridium ragsdalei P11 TaxID=1353534 RepID=A0A1A6AV60_9CLOT|nr:MULTISPECIES: TetM/TetW/TetO/TetS family tetracycline resistance ribosomal protection protein [Clostridium]OBR93923.1 tetracycline resistance protein TetM [Clostridium ragsdalei P11]QXE17785.1 elongation factor G [Clostridium sp. 001]
MNKTIGLFAHVDAGKTTLAEQILYHTKSIKNLGRVDHKDSFLDNNDIEKNRGITIFSDEAVFKYKSSTYYLVDTPGHADFSSEMERTIEIMDYAIVIISAVEGVQAQTEIVWQLLKKHGIPTFFFINKVDRVGANVEGILKDIRVNLTEDVCFISESVQLDKISKEIMEFAAERSDKLLEKYIEEDFTNQLWLDSIRDMISKSKLFPCMSGSALQDKGIDDFLEKLDVLTFTKYNDREKFQGIVYKIRHDKQKNKITYIKILEGTLKVRDEIAVNTSQDCFEKVTQIRICNGDKFKTVDEASAGELAAVSGLSNSIVGCGLGNCYRKVNYEMVPALKSRVIFDKSLNEKDVLACFKILEEEDPALKVSWNEKLGEIQVNIMGTIQLEVLKELVKERFDLPIDFGPCEILYKETIVETFYGCGHFEPLRHYAEVYLKLEPGERNSGISFYNECSTDDLDINYQKLIGKHIYERDHHGILTGFPITDIKITLITGRSHVKHTCGGDFREATFRALRQGLEGVKNILLEPYYRFKIKVSSDYMGRVLSDIQKLKGSFENPDNLNGEVIITGRGPVSTFMNYAVDFISFTKGRGKINFVLDGYDICHNEGEVIEKMGYDKNADIEYTSTSVFCSKGEPFLVKGDRAREYMHCLK